MGAIAHAPASTPHVYDALVSQRVYRDALGHARAIEIIAKEEGAAFDPECARKLRALLAGDSAADITLTGASATPAHLPA